MMKFTKLFLAALLALSPAHAQVIPSTAVTQSIETNYLSNGGFENGKTGWVTYKDAAGALPVDGTGGTAAVTIAASTTTPIAEKASLVFTKGASNLQGEGFSTDFTINKAAKGLPMYISGKYEITSGTYSGGTTSTDSDITVYIYDKDTSTLIQPASFKLDGGVSGYTYSINATFNPMNVASTNYRLIVHIATTSASAYTLKLDQIKLGVGNKAQGPPVTDWSAQETTTGTLTNATYNRKWRRVGDTTHERVQILFTGSPGGTNPLQITTKFTIDTAKLNGGAISNTESLGVAHLTDVSTGLRYTGSVAVGTTSTQIRVQGDSATTGNWGSTNPVTIASPDVIEVDFSYPTAGFSSSLTMSDSSDTRIVSFKAYKSGGNQNGVSGVNTFTSAADDTHAGFNLAAGSYTIRVPGDYFFTMNNEWTAPQGVGFIFRINGSQTGTYSSSASSVYNSHAVLVPNLKAGDAITVSSSTGSVLNLLDFFFSGFRLSGPSQVAASEKVAFSVSQNTGQAISAGSDQIVICNLKNFDTHNIYNTSTGQFRFPKAGIVSISARFLTANLAAGTTAYYGQVVLYKNGSLHKYIGGRYNPGAGTTTYTYGDGSLKFSTLTTDLWDVRIFYSLATTVTTDSPQNYIDVEME